MEQIEIFFFYRFVQDFSGGLCVEFYLNGVFFADDIFRIVIRLVIEQYKAVIFLNQQVDNPLHKDSVVIVCLRIEQFLSVYHAAECKFALNGFSAAQSFYHRFCIVCKRIEKKVADIFAVDFVYMFFGDDFSVGHIFQLMQNTFIA